MSNLGLGWSIFPSADSIPGVASAGYEFTRKNPIEDSWLESGGIPSNKTGIPFGLSNGILSAVWVGSSDLYVFDVEVYWHLGDEIGLTSLTTVTFTGVSRIQTFDASDFGTVSIPQDVQFACQVKNIVGSSPTNVKVYLRPTGDQPA